VILGLYAPRRSFFVIAGPLARAAMQRGHEVVYVGDPADAKPDDEWTKDELPEAIAGDVVIRPEMFAGDWLAGPPPLPYVRGVKWCHLEAWYDQLTVRADFAHVQHRTLRHGMLALDGLADVPFTDERHLLWFPPKTRIPGPHRAWRYAMTCVLAIVLWRAARHARVKLLIKTRAKIRLPKLVEVLADEVLGDDTLYPWASLTALRRASLAVVHQSAAGCEAAAAGVLALSVRLPQWHLRHCGTYALMRARQGSPYAWPGVVESMSVEGAARWLDHWEPTMTQDHEARRAYVDSWLAGRTRGVAEEIIQRMEAM